VARKLGLTVTQIRDEERETADLSLSVLYRWQQALGVPVAELLVQQDDALSPSIRTRSRLLKIMKTVRTLEQHTCSPASARLITQLAGQLLELMPELRDVGGWQGTGHRRTLDELGRIADNPFPDHILMDAFEV
jgi:transcriptional regulator with XRE-family HTH domain